MTIGEESVKMVNAKRARENRQRTKQKRHHVVPQAYLRAWADNRNQIVVYDGRADHIFTADTKNAAVRTKLYTLDLDDGTETDELERLFAQVEGPISEGIRSLRDGTWPMSPDERYLIANFIALQLARAPGIPEATEQMMAQVTEMAAKMQSAMSQMKAETSPEEYAAYGAQMDRMRAVSDNPSYSLEEFQELHRHPTLLALNGVVDLVDPIAHLDYTLLESDGEEFLTSDQPVAHWPLPGQPAWMSTGLLNAQKSTLPISPHLCIQFEVPADVTAAGSDYRRRVASLEVARINQRTFLAASRHVVMRPGVKYLGFNFPSK